MSGSEAPRPILPGPCPAALGAFGVPARRWTTRADLFAQLEIARAFLATAPIDATVSEAAREAGISEFHFARLFRETFGESPSAFHRRSVLERALGLLEGMTVSEVAVELGYRSVSSFVRAFRLATGRTPAATRRSLVSGQFVVRTS